MADGTPDFADLLAAFDETPAVTLQQITSGHAANLPLPGGLPFSNQPTYIPGQNHGHFPDINQGQGAASNQLGQIGQDAGLQNTSFIQADAPSEESFSGGSLGSMFLSSVESLLSDPGSNFTMQIQQPVATVRTVPRKPRQQRPKSNNVQQNRNNNMQQNRNVPNTNSQQFINVSPAVTQVQTTTLPMMNVGLNSNHNMGMKVTNAVGSPPFIQPTDSMQAAAPSMHLAGQQKMQQGPFVHPTQQSTRQQQPQSVNSPRPLSAASSTSEHLSRPGSVPQASPSCGSNHSGDPGTPLTPQSYNAGTPQSYKPATPQSYNAGTPQSYKPATPQSYKPATPQSNLSQPQQRMRTGQFGDIHQQQVTPGSADNFMANQRSNVMFQPVQPSPIQTMNTSNDSLNDLPTPVKDAFNTVCTSSDSFHTQIPPMGNQEQLWNQGPAVMAPSALFTSAAQPKPPNAPNFIPSDSQINFGYLDSNVCGVPLQFPNRTESNVRSESLTLKQNELLEQLSSFGKNKAKAGVPAGQTDQSSGFSSSVTGSTTSSHQDLGKSDAPKLPGSGDTMNMMNKAYNAGAATVKELLGTHPQYEAISPVSDYVMSPARKTSLHDDLSESILFSPPKFPSSAELPLPVPQDMDQPHGDSMTDPVLVYLKHDNEKTGPPKSTNVTVATTSTISSSYFSHNITAGMPLNNSEFPQSWFSQTSAPTTRNLNLKGTQSSCNTTNSVPLATSSIHSVPSCQSSAPVQMTAWSSQMQPVTMATSMSFPQTPHALLTKAVEISPSKQANSFTRIQTQMSPSKQKLISGVRPTNAKTSDPNKPFGVKRKSSVDRARSSTSKTKKGAAYDEKFGFDSDDDTEPTICLSKVSPTKSNKKQNLLSPKPSNADVIAGEELKNKMERLKQLQQQQAKLRKIQEYQAQHGGRGHLQPTSVAVNMHRALASQLATTKPMTPMEMQRKSSQEIFTAFNSQNQPAFPLFPVAKDARKVSQNVATKKHTPLEFPTPLSLAQPSISSKFSDSSKVHIGSHDIQPALSSIQSSVVTCQAPHFLSYLNLPLQELHQAKPSSIEKTKATDILTPITTQSPPITTQSRVTEVSFSMTTTPAPLNIQSLLSQPTKTSASQIPSYSASFLRNDIPPRISESVAPAKVSASFDRENKSQKVAAVSQSENLTSSRSHPFDYSHFNLDWLKEPVPIVPEKTKTTESASAQPQVATPPRDLSMSARVSLAAPSRPSVFPVPSSSINTPLSKPMLSLPEDLPLKQSIHTVHHLQTAKTQALTSRPAIPPPKENPPVSHEPKHFNLKHRILEGYPQSSSDSFKSSATAQNNAPSVAPTAATGHSVLDKQRKYSKERANVKPRHRIQHQVMDTPKTQTPVSANSQMLTPTSEIAKPVASSGNTLDSKASKEEQKEKATNEKQKDDQSGMLLLFNSLLQEASQSAKDSLKTTLNAKPEEKQASSQSSDVTKPLKQVTMTASKVVDALKPNPVSVSSDKGIVTSSSVTMVTSSIPSSTSLSLPPAKKAPKKNRPAATVPFKRRPYPAFDDSLNTTMVTSVSAVPVTLQSLVTSSGPKSTASSSITTPVTTQSSVPTSKPVSIMTNLLTTPSATVAVKEVPVPSPSTAPKSPSKSLGLPKLRITAFRSTKGMVIHQSSVLVGENESVDSDASSHRRSRKKKKRKRKRKTSSSDNDSTVSSSTVKSVAEQTAILAQEAKVNEQITKELEKKAEEISKSVEYATAKSQPIEEKLPQKRKRTKGTGSDNVTEKKKPAKRVRTARVGLKKKQDEKNEEPVIRYQPKSALQVVSTANGTSVTVTKTSVSLPSTFHRGPGKLPLYLSSSESKSATTVPTIQLVARNTKLIGAVENSKTSQSAKVLSVKIANSLQSKSFQTHLLSSGVQYIIPTTRSQPRVILPNSSVSAPVTVPVSIVSPLLARSLSGGFVPVSILTTTSPSTKPQLFTVPVTAVDSQATPIKIITTKQNDVAKKSSSDAPSAAKILPLNLTLPLTKTSTKSSSGILAKLSTSSVTVSGTSTAPRVATKVLSPNATSMSANNFRSTFLKLISSQNPVPTYVPPSPPTHLKMDLSGRKQHQCLECKDTFMFSDSLEDHYQRRCILIKVRCMQCDKDLVFLNKCKLLLHARQHSDKGGNGMQFNNAHISPLPMSMCKARSKESFLKSNSAKSRRISSINSEDENSIAGSSPTYPTMLACTDCNFSGTTPEALEEHFQRVSPPVSPDKAVSGPKPPASFSCEMCSVTVPNQCSFNAHMRMHKRARPHTCPECGQTFDNDGLQEYAFSEGRREMIDFNLHLSIHCFHLSRMSAYKCKICTSIFENADLLRRHLEVRHLQTFYKCCDCPMAFKTHENISSHQRSKHGVVAVTKTIHKCPLCETVFTDNSTTQQLFLLQKHFEGHMTHPSINITAYKCLFCSNIYERKSLLRDHLKSAHDVTALGDGSNSPGLAKDWNEARLFVGLEKRDGAAVNAVQKRLSVKSSMKEPVAKISKMQLPDKNTASNLRIASGIIEGSKKSHYSNSSNLDSPGTMKSAKQPLKLRLKGMTQPGSCNASSAQTIKDDMDQSSSGAVIFRDGKKVYPCGDCSKELPSASARLNHIRLKHKGIRTLYCCPHCPSGKIKFAKKISLKRHLKKAHNIEEVRKQDVMIEYVKLPIGHRFDPATTIRDQQDVKVPRSSSPQKVAGFSGDHKVRKKITALARRTNRSMRQSRRDIENGSPYLENSDSEVEQIMSNNRDNLEDKEKSDGEEPDFSLLRLPSTYSCAKCDFQSKDRIEFQIHIMEHREDAENEGMLSALQQCSECGLCFASLASHAKHLFIKHKIKRKKLLEKYDRKLRAEKEANGSLPCSLDGKGTSGPLNGPGPTNRYKCTVCYKRFENDTQLRTHMRNHGLAFVKSKHVS